ncbi:MAG: hypothetical protein ACT4PP_13475 [Sporichthyaceae bacterium]
MVNVVLTWCQRCVDTDQMRGRCAMSKKKKDKKKDKKKKKK